MGVGQHAVRAGKSIPLSIWTRLQASKSNTVQKWRSPQGGQVHYTDVAAGASDDRGRSLAFSFV